MKNFLKIGVVCYPSIGGSGIVATTLGNELANLGHEIHFISYEKPFRANLELPNVHFHQVNINKYELFRYPDYTLPLAETISMVHQRYNLDIVHVHYAVPHATAALLACQILEQCKFLPFKIITTLHGTDITLLSQDPNLFSVIKYSIEKSHGVTTVSESLRQSTWQNLETDKDIKVIYNFYTPPPITHSREWVRKKLKVKNDDFLAIHLSNLRPVKRIPDLLKIVQLMKKEPKFKLLILAGGDFSKYQALAKKYKIQKNLIVKNNIFDIENYINAADIGIYTSETESFGLGILETFGYGKPVLATDAGGIPEVLQNGKQGFLYPVGDVKGFAKGVKTLISNPETLKSLGSAAQQRALTVFTKEKIIRQYLDYYHQILK